MSEALVIQMAREIAERINCMVYGDKVLEAELDLVPNFALSELQQQRIVVVPAGIIHKNASRVQCERTGKIDIGVTCRCKKEELPGLIAMVEWIAENLRGEKIASGLVTELTFQPIYDPGYFKSNQVFLSICTATVKAIR